MSVEIDPSELGFRRPFNVEVAQILKIRNLNTQPVAFKVKTTAPKQYCVRPNSGRIEPDHEVEVTVLLQAMKQDPPADTRCRDKFLVQSVLISGDKGFSSVQEIWDSVEKSSIQERKIRVSFLPAKSGDMSTPIRKEASTNGFDATPDVPPPAYGSPPERDAPTGPTPNPSQSSEPSPSSSSLEVKDQGKREADSPAAAAASSFASTTAVASSVVQSAVEQVKAQASGAKAAVASSLEDAGPKMRKTAAGVASAAKAQSEKVPASSAVAPVTKVHPAAAAQQPVTEGVPVKITALLCLLSFLLAYFFF